MMLSADALGRSAQGMWHDPNGIEYPYDAEDLRILERARLAKLELDKSDGIARDE